MRLAIFFIGIGLGMIVGFVIGVYMADEDHEANR